MLSDFIAMCWLVYWYCSVYGVEYHQVNCQLELGAFLYKGADVASTKNFYANRIMCELYMCYSCGFPFWIMNITSVLYCVAIHRYTQCYTYVILGVILLLLYSSVYSVPTRNVITCR